MTWTPPEPLLTAPAAGPGLPPGAAQPEGDATAPGQGTPHPGR
ncbi:hypothetical protein ACVV2G_30835 [Streptomyces ziwulingensis]